MIYGYGRVSTKGQAKDGNSLEAQERLLKEHGAEVIYMDSFTGTKMTRPEFDKLLEKLKAGDTLVVAKLDRFARSVSQASDLITKLIDEGIRVDACNLGVLCFLQALFGQSCKTFLDIIASPNWTKLQSLDWQLSCQPHSHCRQYLVVTA